MRQIVREAVAPFYDDTLASRTRAAKQIWQVEAQAALEDQIDDNLLTTIREGAEADLNALREKLRSLEMEVEGLDLDLPPFDLPEPVTDGANGPALVKSDMALLNHIRTLKDRKNYSANDFGGAS